MDSNVLIGGTTLLLKPILEILEQKHLCYQNLINSGKSVTSFNIKNISSGFGHGSIVYKLILHFTSSQKNTCQESFSVALKIPSCEIFYQQKLKINPNLPKNIKEIISYRVAGVHKNECYFYSKTSPFLNLKIPKIYACKEWIVGKEQGYILMEDLSENGIVLTKYDFVLVDKIKVVVKEIAHMQAEWIKASMEVEWKDGGSEENQKMWAKITEDFLSFIPAFIDLVDDKEKVKKAFNKIMVLAGNKDYHVWAFQDAYKELGLPTVLVHGDLWNSNMFFKKDAENEVLAFVDWQMAYEGSPAADLTRYLLLNAEGHVRRKIESSIFSFYIECINSEIPNIKFNKNQIRKAYIYAFISEFMGLLMITVNNAKTLQHSINNGENVAHNLKIKNKIILQALDAMEDVEKFMDVELADIVERFKYQKIQCN